MLKESPLMRSFHFTMDEEGGETYTNDPRDPGGPTKYGVALNYNLGTIPDKDGDGKITARRSGSGPCRHPVQHRPRRCPPHPATGRQCLRPGHRRGRQDRPGHSDGNPSSGT